MMCYRVVAVFTERPHKGNALTIFPDASGIDADSHGAADRPHAVVYSPRSLSRIMRWELGPIPPSAGVRIGSRILSG